MADDLDHLAECLQTLRASVEDGVLDTYTPQQRNGMIALTLDQAIAVVNVARRWRTMALEAQARLLTDRADEVRAQTLAATRHAGSA